VKNQAEHKNQDSHYKILLSRSSHAVPGLFDDWPACQRWNFSIYTKITWTNVVSKVLKAMLKVQNETNSKNTQTIFTYAAGTKKMHRDPIVA